MPKSEIPVGKCPDCKAVPEVLVLGPIIVIYCGNEKCKSHAVSYTQEEWYERAYYEKAGDTANDILKGFAGCDFGVRGDADGNVDDNELGRLIVPWHLYRRLMNFIMSEFPEASLSISTRKAPNDKE